MPLWNPTPNTNQHCGREYYGRETTAEEKRPKPTPNANRRYDKTKPPRTRNGQSQGRTASLQNDPSREKLLLSVSVLGEFRIGSSAAKYSNFGNFHTERTERPIARKDSGKRGGFGGQFQIGSITERTERPIARKDPPSRIGFGGISIQNAQNDPAREKILLIESVLWEFRIGSIDV